MSSALSYKIYKELRYLVLKNIRIISTPIYIKYFGNNYSMSMQDFFNLRKDIIKQLELYSKFGIQFHPNLYDKYNNSSLQTLKYILNIT